MALASTDIDEQLENMANNLRQLRVGSREVKRTVNRAVSELSQLATTYSDVIDAVSGLEGSSNPVDQLQAAKLAKITSEAADLFTKVRAVKKGIDQLGL